MLEGMLARGVESVLLRVLLSVSRRLLKRCVIRGEGREEGPIV